MKKIVLIVGFNMLLGSTYMWYDLWYYLTVISPDLSEYLDYGLTRLKPVYQIPINLAPASIFTLTGLILIATSIKWKIQGRFER